MEPSTPDLAGWIGRSTTLRDAIAAAPVVALNATLDHPPVSPETGFALPPLWHWLYFHKHPEAAKVLEQPLLRVSQGSIRR